DAATRRGSREAGAGARAQAEPARTVSGLHTLKSPPEAAPHAERRGPAISAWNGEDRLLFSLWGQLAVTAIPKGADMDIDLSHRTAIVTGSTAGIGLCD